MKDCKTVETASQKSAPDVSENVRMMIPKCCPLRCSFLTGSKPNLTLSPTPIPTLALVVDSGE